MSVVSCIYKRFYETKHGPVRVKGLQTWVRTYGFNIENRNPEYEKRTDVNGKKEIHGPLTKLSGQYVRASDWRAVQPT